MNNLREANQRIEELNAFIAGSDFRRRDIDADQIADLQGKLKVAEARIAELKLIGTHWEIKYREALVF